MKTPKKIPYGISNYESLRTENYVYVDKTRFIEQIENEPTKYHFLIRPRKFGKSLFLSTLRHYYDVCSADKFDVLFGDLYIGKNPTPKRNSLFIMKFSFSGLDTSSVEKFQVSFTGAIRGSIQSFLTEHRFIIKDYEALKKEAWTINNVRDYIEFAFDIIESFGTKAYIIIDEYDHFANDLIAQGTNLSLEQYKQLIWANGVVRDFYETLKDNTETVIDKIFITGVTPIMLDDVTSGFNISNNLSVDVRYNEMLGFTEEEVEFLIDECGIDREKIVHNIKFLYNGYLFNIDGENKVYNSAMILFFLYKVLIAGEKAEIIDDNLKTDYGRIRNLITQFENKSVLKELSNNVEIQASIIKKFSILHLHEHKNFLSLLFYMGMVTISKNETTGIASLKIPNYTVKTNYWEYIERFINEEIPANTRLPYHPVKFYEFLGKLALEHNPRPFLDFINGNFVDILSNRDLIKFNEKDIKILMMTLIFQSDFYLPISEFETSGGYCDIYLQRRNSLYPKIETDWVWEIKYIKQSDSENEQLIAEKKMEAITQLQRYKNSTVFKDRTDVRFLAVVFIGKKEYFVEEVICET